jgi:ETC complex I subunit conserved region
VPKLTPSVFPADAHAVIYRPAPSPMTSGRARRQRWKLRFERRYPQYVEPLMGWTADDDPLTQVELSFPSAESAVAYARRQGLQYTVEGLPDLEPKLRLVSARSDAGGRADRTQRQRRLEWVERTLGPEVIGRGFRPGADPALLYADPQDVLQDSNLSQEQQRELLRRWALEAYQIELEHARGKRQAEPSRLEEVMDALLKFDQENLEKMAG